MNDSSVPSFVSVCVRWRNERRDVGRHLGKEERKNVSSLKGWKDTRGVGLAKRFGSVRQTFENDRNDECQPVPEPDKFLLMLSAAGG